MTPFRSPAIYQSGAPHGATLRRSVLGLASCVLAAMSWVGAGSLAQRSAGEDTLSVSLPTVTIVGRRQPA